MSRHTSLLLARLKLGSEDSTDHETTELTSAQNGRTLAGRSAVIRPEGVLDYNRHYVNNLPTTSPHGSCFGILEKICKVLANLMNFAIHTVSSPPEVYALEMDLDDNIEVCLGHLPEVDVLRIASLFTKQSNHRAPNPQGLADMVDELVERTKIVGSGRLRLPVSFDDPRRAAAPVRWFLSLVAFVLTSGTRLVSSC